MGSHRQSTSLAFRPPLSFRGFPGGSEGKDNMGDQGLIPGSGRLPWRREWQPTPVFLPGESHGQRTLADYSPRGHQESNMTERSVHTWSFSAWCPSPWGFGHGLLVQCLCSPGIPSSPGGQSQTSCEWMWCSVAAEGGNGRGKTRTKDKNYVVYTKLASLMAHSKESACQCKRHRFKTWVWKITWRRK